VEEARLKSFPDFLRYEFETTALRSSATSQRQKGFQQSCVEWRGGKFSTKRATNCCIKNKNFV